MKTRQNNDVLVEERVALRFRVDANATAMLAADQLPVLKLRQNPLHRGRTHVKLLGQTGNGGQRLRIDAALDPVSNRLGYCLEVI